MNKVFVCPDCGREEIIEIPPCENVSKDMEIQTLRAALEQAQAEKDAAEQRVEELESDYVIIERLGTNGVFVEVIRKEDNLYLGTLKVPSPFELEARAAGREEE